MLRAAQAVWSLAISTQNLNSNNSKSSNNNFSNLLSLCHPSNNRQLENLQWAPESSLLAVEVKSSFDISINHHYFRFVVNP
jgi:hypothetical protein